MLEYSTVRYLYAKLSVDDRALNRGVLDAFKSAVSALAETPKVLELGAGVGTMVSRLSELSVIGSADYTLLDSDPVSLAEAKAHLGSWGGAARSRVRFLHAEAFDFMNRAEQAQAFDVVMANAVLDLMDLTPALESIWRVLRPGGLFWFSINFDGETIFLPELALDDTVMRLYHETMDQRVRAGRPAGDSKTGRHLLTRLGETGACLEAAGSSDWVVFPKHGHYPGDEAYFLHHIVHTIDEALKRAPQLDSGAFAHWVRQRHQQIDAGTLCYIAHQLDVFGTLPESRPSPSG